MPLLPTSGRILFVPDGGAGTPGRLLARPLVAANITTLAYGIKTHPNHRVDLKNVQSIATDQIEARVPVPIVPIWGFPGTVVQVTVYLALEPHVLAPVQELTVPYKLCMSASMKVCVNVHPDYSINWVSLT